MAEDLSDQLDLGDDSDNPQRPLTAKRAGDHIQRKHPLQQPRPVPSKREVTMQRGRRMRPPVCRMLRCLLGRGV